MLKDIRLTNSLLDSDENESMLGKRKERNYSFEYPRDSNYKRAAKMDNVDDHFNNLFELLVNLKERNLKPDQ